MNRACAEMLMLCALVGKKDFDRFKLAVSQIAGKRLTYAELTGKVGETIPF
jgi:hypothetical protein